MREIKFRAFNNFDRCLVHDIIFERGSFTLNQFFSEDRFTFMLYTGWKDKSGKEIFEGDILRVSSNLSPMEMLERGLGSYDLLLVSWENVQFVTQLTDSEYSATKEPLNEIDLGDAEVIGNIYENPELLNNQGGVK